MISSIEAFYDLKFTDEKGLLAPEAKMYSDNLSQTLNLVVILLNSITSTVVNDGNVTLNGLNPPSLTTAEITALVPGVPVGTIWYNSDISKLQFKATPVTVETITST